ncbi:MAG: single-stranded DNA-binding protein [Rudanella sp.]|nr:single-stranded DNA-binding protein [Rudanella sp.]
MAGVNKVILIGNLGADPEIRHLDGGSTIARFNIATTEAYNNKNGERVEQTEWHRIEMWDNLAKIAEQYLKKGSQVYVEGKLRTEAWKDKEGVDRTTLRIRVTNMTLIGSRPNNDGNDGGYEAPPRQQAATPQQQTQPQRQSSPAPAPAPAAPPKQQARREPEPTPFEGNSGDDDLPF